MNGRTMIERLEALCRDMDEGRPLFRLEWGGARALAPVAVGIAMSLGSLGCGAEPVNVYGAPPQPAIESNCTGGLDDDHDGLTDCMDPDCAAASACMTSTMYGAPMPQPQIERMCTGGFDDDHDGLADCQDPDCSADAACAAVEMYGAPMPAPAEQCGNGLDDDRDGLADCADGDCAGLCNAVAAYASPGMPAAELCGGGADEDGDGLVDCGDPDCASQCASPPARRYGAPFPR